ncbi:MAG: CoA transferase [Chloroflexi bacterium]|nr:CoA transferase [Chloroflexota bacterium]
MRMPLEGVRVIERAAGIAGPTAALMLADLGAEVIKIEEPAGSTRSNEAVRGGTAFRKDMSKENLIRFITLNRNKKSITVDLQQRAGQEVVHRLAQKSDVFVTSFAKPVASKLSVDYETLSGNNPQIIYARVSGFGPKGPDSDKRVWDSIAQARSGLMMCLGERGAPPSLMVGSISDVLTGTVCALGTITALFSRERTGVGLEIDSSMLHSALWVQMAAITKTLSLGRLMPRFGRTQVNNPLSNFYKCGDGNWLMVWEALSDRYWGEFCKALSLEAIQEDPRFCHSQARKEHREQLIAILDEAFGSRTRSDWLKRFAEHKANFAYSPVQDALDLPSDPQVIENGYFTECDFPFLGPTKVVNFPVKFSEAQSTEGSGRVAELGEDNQEILSGVAGYSEDEIADLRDHKVI